MDDELRWTAWQHDFQDLRATVERLEKTFREFDLWLREHYMGNQYYRGEFPEPVASLVEGFHESVKNIRCRCEAVEERFSNPLRYAARGLHLTEEQYYLARAGGLDLLWWVGFRGETESADDFVTLKLLYYTGERRQGYINVTLKSTGRDRTTGEPLYPLLHGVPPEWCRRSELRPEQHEFFRTRLPDVYARFKE